MLRTLTPASALPIDLAQARQHLRLDVDDENTLIDVYIAAAVRAAEHQTERALMATRYRLELNAWPCRGGIVLPRSPLLTVREVAYAPSPGAAQVVIDPAEYATEGGEPSTLWPRASWPAMEASPGAVRITFDAGYATPITVGGSLITPEMWPTLTPGDPVRFANSGGALPAPLQARRHYYVHAVSGESFSVRDTPTGTTALTLTSGTGLSTLGSIPEGILHWILIRIETMHTYRGEVEAVQGGLSPLPYVDRLLDPYRVYSG